MFETNWLVSQSYMMKLAKTIEKSLLAIISTKVPSNYLVLTGYAKMHSLVCAEGVT